MIMSNYLIKNHNEYYEWFKEKELPGKELEVILLLKEIEILYYIRILVPMELKQDIWQWRNIL